MYADTRRLPLQLYERFCKYRCGYECSSIIRAWASCFNAHCGYVEVAHNHQMEGIHFQMPQDVGKELFDETEREDIDKKKWEELTNLKISSAAGVERTASGVQRTASLLPKIMESPRGSSAIIMEIGRSSILSFPCPRRVQEWSLPSSWNFAKEPIWSSHHFVRMCVIFVHLRVRVSLLLRDKDSCCVWWDPNLKHASAHLVCLHLIW